MYLREIIARQKQEKKRMLTTGYVPRERSRNIDKYIRTDLIKVVSGGRRCGKSVFCFMALKDKKFGYVNFDEKVFQETDNYDDIIKYLHEYYGDVKILLLDEIQNLDKWELWVNSLQRRGYNLLITGSNAKLLSMELSTHLTGRYQSLELFPFSFSEYLSAKSYNHEKQDTGQLLNHLKKYLKTGGYPEIVVKNYDNSYLQNLFDSIILKDVVKRYNIKYSDDLYNLAKYLISSFSEEISFTKLKNIMKFRSVHTVQNYVRYLTETYLIFQVERFSFKQKEQITSPRKIYVLDTGLINAIAFRFRENLGRLIENCVALELLRQKSTSSPDTEIYYWKNPQGLEVDFLIKKGINIKELIQVCYNLDNLNTKERELKSLVKASEDTGCSKLLVITWDYENEEEYRGKKIIYIPLWKWLLN